MKQLKRSGIYTASNVTFDPITCRAYSYGWWRFVDKVKEKVVFNTYRYSNTTARHQSKVRTMLSNLGIGIDLEIEAPNGLQSNICQQMHSPNARPSVEAHYSRLIQDLELAIAKPRSQASKNKERKEQIKEYKAKIKAFKRLYKNMEDL